MSETVSGPVSRGFKPYPEYRDSGVEWLGGIPAHWEVKRTKHIFRVINGSTPKSSEPEYWDGNIAWVTPDDLGSLFKPEIIETARRISIDGYRSCGTTLVPPNSLVLSTRAPIGHLAIAGTELCTNQGCRCLVSHNEISSRFYYYMILAAKQELESLGQGSTFNELGKQELEFVSLPFPSLSEQRAIADFLDRETARIDALIERKQR
ncbi:MAG: restriction endonuclease subunit S, partial [Spirochaetota bacterium]|nr:restriction endonuclease subunit S [Spirochaetota bacterium]